MFRHTARAASTIIPCLANLDSDGVGSSYQMLEPKLTMSWTASVGYLKTVPVGTPNGKSFLSLQLDNLSPTHDSPAPNDSTATPSSIKEKIELTRVNPRSVRDKGFAALLCCPKSSLSVNLWWVNMA